MKKGQYFSCQSCGKQFYRSRSYIVSHKNIRFCCGTCHKSSIASGSYKPGPVDGPRPYRRLGKNLVCQICGKPYYRKASEISYGVDKTCSITCRHKWLSGSRNHFSQTLKIPPRPRQWARKQRNAWLKSSCERCGSKTRLELDHIVPRGPNTQANAQTLCRTCNQRKYWFEDRLHYQHSNLGG